MTSLRSWIVLLAVTSFLAGLAGGLWVAEVRSPRESGPFASYAIRLERAFHLDRKRTHWLRTALAEYETEIEALKLRGVGPLEDELVQAGKRCNDRIREHVIPEDRRAEFDRLSGGHPLSTEALR